MRHSFFLSSLCICLFLGCKNRSEGLSAEKKQQSPKPEKTILQKIAQAHGYENWKQVREFTFTFNVDRDSSHFERSWVWKPKINEITFIAGQDSTSYLRSSMDSTALDLDKKFINDRYWILAPFNLIWDSKNFTYTLEESQKAPIAGTLMQKLTIVYGSAGGYTPGDAYDFYFNEDFILREWVFRKQNQADPSLTTTWENYTSVGGLKLALDHKKADGSFNLNFTNLALTQ